MKQRGHSIDIVVGLLLFCVFTISMLMVLLTGADGYRKISEGMESQFSERTCLSYLVTKIRHYDSLNAEGVNNVRIVDFEGIPAIALDEYTNEMFLTTLMYCYDGYLYELYTLKGSDFSPDDVLPVLAIDEVRFEYVLDSLLKLTVVADGRELSQYVFLQSGSGTNSAPAANTVANREGAL